MPWWLLTGPWGRLSPLSKRLKLMGCLTQTSTRSFWPTRGTPQSVFAGIEVQQIILSQLQDGVLSSDFITQTELAAAAEATAEERDIRYLIIPDERLSAGLEVAEEAMLQVYEAEPDRWTSEPSVIAEYIELSRADFIQPVDEELLEQQFESVREEYTVAEQALIAHILLIKGEDESQGVYGKRIKDVAARLAAGEDFAALAAELSDDVGSASLGGELGFTDGSVFPEEMEEAISSLDSGGVTGPVVTDAGTHFIRVLERTAGETPDYDRLRDELAQSMQEADAEQALLVVVDELRELSFNAGDLGQPADALALTVSESGPVSMTQGEGVFAEQAVRDVLFSPEVYDAGNNSDVVELSGNRFVVVRVSESDPQSCCPLSRLRAPFVASWKAVPESPPSWPCWSRSGPVSPPVSDLRRWPAPMIMSGVLNWAPRRVGSLLPAEVVDTAFAMDLAVNPAIERVELINGDMALVELARIEPGRLDNLTEAEQDAMALQLAELQGQLALLEYRNAANRRLNCHPLR